MSEASGFDYPPPPIVHTEFYSDVFGARLRGHKGNEVVTPTPIATLMFENGRRVPIYEPLSGHEHLFSIQSVSKDNKKTSILRRKKPATDRKGILKRTRSVAQGLTLSCKADVDGNLNATDHTIQDVPGESHTFYIGDIDAFKDFLTRRFDELTMRPLRGIATHWIKFLAPRQIGEWGTYHNMLPSKASTPPWWPRTVIYKEPSHLNKSELFTLAVEIMMVHRKVDVIKRRKGPKHSQEMKKIALNEILPSIFDIAQSYKDHIVQYNLFEGSGNADPGRGKHHTWKPISKPVRELRGKRQRRTVADHLDLEASGDRSKPVDTVTKLRRATHRPQAVLLPQPRTTQSQPNIQTPGQSITAEDSNRKAWEMGTPVWTCEPCTPERSKDDYSFDQSLHWPHLAGEVSAINSHARTIFDQGIMHPPCNMGSHGQPVHPTAWTGFTNQAYHPMQNYLSRYPLQIP
ncbi:hypothetical protein BU25DRAFT_493300 [Macroventuria anomochaeta]|uniref:Uncharacterized protein n=1 Tax=Macroventuria anomochaeta TaxID=301207 RepID=A0ACB6RSI6_9PLEO|nr:uncharacterized protein BU25DRAFT_493300 [Macroventuria anomochaeta]KAF2625011.1 hypothetical protein BU25DRAFT_493300 [Macroventuria anomochaeta]